MLVRIWGCRGSLPSPGAGTVRVGGNTACVSVEADGGLVVIFDAGTGIRGLGRRLAGEGARATRIALLASHGHMDHTQGLPFFAPLHEAGRKVTLLNTPGRRTDEALLRPFDGVGFPLKVEDLAAEVVIESDGVAWLAREGLTLSTIAANHPGGSTGYRLSRAGGASGAAGTGSATAGGGVVYLTDNELRPPGRGCAEQGGLGAQQRGAVRGAGAGRGGQAVGAVPSRS